MSQPPPLPSLGELFFEMGLPPLDHQRLQRLIEGARPIITAARTCTTVSLFSESPEQYVKALEALAADADQKP